MRKLEVVKKTQNVKGNNPNSLAFPHPAWFFPYGHSYQKCEKTLTLQLKVNQSFLLKVPQQGGSSWEITKRSRQGLKKRMYRPAIG